MELCLVNTRDECWRMYLWDWTFVVQVARRHGWKPKRNLAAKVEMLEDDPTLWKDWLTRHPGERIGPDEANALGNALIEAVRAAELDPSALAGPQNELVVAVNVLRLLDIAEFLKRGGCRLY